MKTCVYLCAPVLACALGYSAAAAAERVPTDPDEGYLRDLKIPTDNAGLMAYLRERANADDDLRNMPALIAQLGDRTFEARQQAEARLKKLGLPALPPLRAALADPDKEVVRRARACIDDIAKESNWSPPLAAARLLVRRKLPEATVPLLRFLPYVGACETTEEEIWFGLSDLAEREPKLRNLLTHVLRDSMSARRALAACILGRQGDDAQKEAVRKLLTDPVTTVRLRAAQGLLAGQDKAAIPTLIALLGDAPIYEAWQAEELLRAIAGTSPPSAVVASDSVSCRVAWDKWWNANGNSFDWSPLRAPGLVLVSDPNGIYVCGCDSVPRVAIGGLNNPYTLGLASNGSVLLLEGDKAQELTSRDHRGRILHKARAPKGIIHAQCLPNGNIFANTRWSHIIEITPDGEEAFCYSHDNQDVHSAHKLMPNSLLCILTKTGEKRAKLVECELGTLRETRTILEAPWPCSFERAGRRIIITQPRTGQVWECDIASGKKVVDLNLSGVRKATPLPNERILAISASSGHERVCELAPSGKVSWEFWSPGASHGLNARTCLNLIRLGFPVHDADLDAPSSRGKELASNVTEVRRRAARALAALGQKAEPALDALIKAMGDPDDSVNRDATTALQNIGKPALPRVIAALKDKNVRIRAGATLLLGSMNSPDRPFIAELVGALDDTNPLVRTNSAHALRRIGRDAKQAVPALIQVAANDEDSKVSQASAFALGEIGTAAQTAVPALLKMLQHEDPDRRHAAGYALGQIGNTSREVIAALAACLEDKKTQNVAAWAIGKLGPKAKDAVPGLMKIVANREIEENTRLNAIIALGEIGPEASAAIGILTQAEGDRAEAIRNSAVVAAKQIKAKKQ